MADKPAKNEKPPELDIKSCESPFAGILERAKTGDPSVVGQLYEISQKYLLLIANQNLDPVVQQKLGASDVVQQSMVVANHKIGGFNGKTKGEFLAWMRKILINECRQAVRGFRKTEKRNVGRERSMAIPGSESGEVQLVDRFLTPSSEAATNEQLCLVADALQQLPDIDRRVIDMRNWQELSFDQIGIEINKSPDAARKIWSRAILRLESELRRRGAI